MKTFEEHWDEQLEKKKLDEEWHKEYKKECKKAKKRKIKEATEQLGTQFNAPVACFIIYAVYYIQYISYELKVMRHRLVKMQTQHKI